jgi:hypothetical protein
MARSPKQPLRPLTLTKRHELEVLTRSLNAPADRVAHVKAILAVTDRATFTQAALSLGHYRRQSITELVGCLNDCGGQPLRGNMVADRWSNTFQPSKLVSSKKWPKRPTSTKIRHRHGR